MKKVNAAEFNELVQSGKPMLADFYADWCGPCKMLKPFLAQVAENNKDVEFVMIDVDAEKELAGSLGVKSLPTIAFFKDGKAVDGFLGFRPKPAIQEFVNKNK